MEQEKIKNNKKENKLGFIVLIFSVLICIISVTYAIWTQLFEGSKEQIITTGTLVLDLTNEEDTITLDKIVPLSDTDGLALTPYKFKVINTGTTNANYRISLVNDEEKYIEDSCSDKKMNWADIMYSFTIDNNVPTMNLLSSNKGILSSGTLNSNKTISCSLRIWIKSDADNSIMGRHFHGKIKIEAIQSDRQLDS